jgi:hypothetical protein
MSEELVPVPAGETAEPVLPEPAPPRPPRRKPAPITSLHAFFERRAAKPAKFLKDMREADRWRFTEEDVEATFETHAERDKTFARTVQLLSAAMRDPERRFVSDTVGFVDRAVRRRLADNPWAVGVDLDSVGPPEERFDTMARLLAPRLREAKHRAEAANLLLATALSLNHSDGFDAETATGKLVDALDLQPSRSGDRQRAKLLWLGDHPKELRPVVELLTPSVLAIAELSAAKERLDANLASEREARQTAEQEVARLSQALADLEKTVAEAQTEIETSREMERAAGVHADHDVRQANARIAGLLDGQLRDLVTTIDEALSVDPPRIHVAREKAEAVLRELDRQVEWLRS